jgi:uncharacterized membrane protein
VLYAVPIVLEKIQTTNTNTNTNTLTWTDKLLISIQYGGLLGLLTYGIYNFTNLAILKNYSIPVTIFDTLWGGILFSIICMACTML